MPGLTYMGSQGNNYAYNNVTFAENEERSPWTPFHVEHGFKPEDSTVSVFTGCCSTAFTLGVREQYWREHVRTCCAASTPTAARPSCSIPSPRANSSTAAVSTPRRS